MARDYRSVRRVTTIKGLKRDVESQGELFPCLSATLINNHWRIDASIYMQVYVQAEQAATPGAD